MGSVTNLLLGRQLAEQYARQEAVRVGLVGGVAVAGSGGRIVHLGTALC
jgi:hypothetical protein